MSLTGYNVEASEDHAHVLTRTTKSRLSPKIMDIYVNVFLTVYTKSELPEHSSYRKYIKCIVSSQSRMIQFRSLLQHYSSLSMYDLGQRRKIWIYVLIPHTYGHLGIQRSTRRSIRNSKTGAIVSIPPWPAVSSWHLLHPHSCWRTLCPLGVYGVMRRRSAAVRPWGNSRQVPQAGRVGNRQGGSYPRHRP
jgi:hypothetical protein